MKPSSAKPQKITFYYGIFLTILTVAVGVGFIVAVARVYYGGLSENPVNPPFTPERIGKAVTVPLILLFIWIAAIICGGVLALVFGESKPKHRRSAVDITDKLEKRMLLSADSDAPILKAVRNYALVRRIVRWVAFVAMMGSAVGVLVSVFSRANYVAEAASLDLLFLLRGALISLSVGFAFCLAALITEAVCARRELKLIKESAPAWRKPAEKSASSINAFVVLAVVAAVGVALFILLPMLFSWMSKEGGDSANIAIAIALFVVIMVMFAAVGIFFGKVSARNEKIIVNCTRVAIAVAAIVFVIVGAINGGALDVLTKAINICTECIGLG